MTPAARTPLRVADLPPEVRARSAALAAAFPPVPGDVLRVIEPVVVPVLQRIGEQQQQRNDAA